MRAQERELRVLRLLTRAGHSSRCVPAGTRAVESFAAYSPKARRLTAFNPRQAFQTSAGHSSKGAESFTHMARGQASGILRTCQPGHVPSRASRLTASPKAGARHSSKGSAHTRRLAARKLGVLRLLTRAEHPGPAPGIPPRVSGEHGPHARGPTMHTHEEGAGEGTASFASYSPRAGTGHSASVSVGTHR